MHTLIDMSLVVCGYMHIVALLPRPSERATTLNGTSAQIPCPIRGEIKSK